HHISLAIYGMSIEFFHPSTHFSQQYFPLQSHRVLLNQLHRQQDFQQRYHRSAPLQVHRQFRHDRSQRSVASHLRLTSTSSRYQARHRNVPSQIIFLFDRSLFEFHRQ